MKTHIDLLSIFTILMMSMGTLFASDIKDDYLTSYFTIESLADNNTVTLSIPEDLTSEQLSWVAYSTDGTNWTTMEIEDTLQIITIVLDQGEKVYYKGWGRQYCNDDALSFCNFNATDDYLVYGNTMSLLYGDDFASQTELPAGSNFTFSGLFQHNDHLVSAENLMLPASVLVIWCYSYMFSDCISLATAPELPATNLAGCCYAYMFKDCSSLTTAPELHASVLYNRCYFRMFKGCTSLTTTHDLSATVLADECCLEMFEGCASLTMAPALPASTLSPFCYGFMFAGCTSLTEAPALPATVLEESCYYYMFAGCASLTEAPELPAINLSHECYESMFAGCTSLTEAPELPAIELMYGCYKGMFGGCVSLTKSPVLPAPVLVFECYTGMFIRCSQLQKVTCLATDISVVGCTYEWLESVAPSGTFIKDPEMEDWPLNSVSGIPEGWNVANWDGVGEQLEQIAVYPNPVKDILHVTGKDIQSVKVFDIQGRLVRSEKGDRTGQVDVDFQGCAEGVYMVSVQAEGGNVARTVIF